MTTDSYIKGVKVNRVRNIKNLDIPLNTEQRSHLILTGKNGSGKTSLLTELNTFLNMVFNDQYKTFKADKTNLENFKLSLANLQSSDAAKNEQLILTTRTAIQNTENTLKRYGGLEIHFSNDVELIEKSSAGEFLIAYFDAKRTTNIQIPSGIHKVALKDKYNPTEKANQAFLQYIVNLKAERSFARDDGEEEEVRKIDLWFENFEKRLQEILEAKSLQLIFDRKNYNFTIEVDNKEPFTLSQLSDGHSAILSILTELILRMEGKVSESYNMQGIVLIDEIETHLHVDLQKKILPFLIEFFPKIQFIVTTHSPFVLSSISNAIICDLENSMVTEDLSGYSYDALIESYFSSSKYSDILTEKLQRYEELLSADTGADLEELNELKAYLESTPKYLSKELLVRLQQLELLQLEQKD